MKRLATAAASAAVAFGAMTGLAAAQSAGCSLINTGPNSNNVCVATNTHDLQVTCNNNVDVVFVNNQSSGSGSVTLENNTNGGYAYSGDAVNTNDTTGNLDVSCGPAKTIAATPPPAAGGQGAQESAKPAVKAAVLPSTGSNPLAITSALALALGGAAGAAQLGAKAYKLFRS